MRQTRGKRNEKKWKGMEGAYKEEEAAKDGGDVEEAKCEETHAGHRARELIHRHVPLVEPSHTGGLERRMTTTIAYASEQGVRYATSKEQSVRLFHGLSSHCVFSVRGQLQDDDERVPDRVKVEELPVARVRICVVYDANQP